MSDAKAALMRQGVSFRHGVVMPPVTMPLTASDIPDIFSVGIPLVIPHISEIAAGGGAGRDRDAAELAAIGEAMERYAASNYQLPTRKKRDLENLPHLDMCDFALFSEAQRCDPAFPYSHLYQDDQEHPYAEVFYLYDNSPLWVPAELVTLSAVPTAIGTSSGLACGRSPLQALLGAVQELIERDALMTTWLHSIPGRRRPLPQRLAEPVRLRKGRVVCIDATPAYSVFPVALVTGEMPERGRPRISLGAGCKMTWDLAVERAFIEWTQGILFAGYYRATHPDLRFATPDHVKTFDEHAVYYSLYPDQWSLVPLHQGALATDAPPAGTGELSATAALEMALPRLQEHGIRLYYRDLTTPDLRQLGLTCVRVLSPDLTPIHAAHAFPFLGGHTADVLMRYPWAQSLSLHFPNPLPHPLG